MSDIVPYEIARSHLPAECPEHEVAHLAKAIEAYGEAKRAASLAEAVRVCERDAGFLQAHGHSVRADQSHSLAVVIRRLIDQPPPAARGEST